MGALTLKSKAFHTRPWEILNKDSLALNDPFLPKIRINIRDKAIFKILPVEDEQEWINDISRFFKTYKALQSDGMVPKLKKSNMLCQEKDKNIFLDKFLVILELFLSKNYKDFCFDVVLGRDSDLVMLQHLKKWHEIFCYYNINITNFFGSSEKFTSLTDKTITEPKNLIIALPTKEIYALFFKELEDSLTDVAKFVTNALTPVKEHIFGHASYFLLALSNGINESENPYFMLSSPYRMKQTTAKIERQIIAEPSANLYSFQNKQQNLKKNIITLQNQVITEKHNLHTVLGITPCLGVGEDLFFPAIDASKDFRVYKKENQKKLKFPVIVLKAQNKSIADTLAACNTNLNLIFAFLFHLNMRQRQ